MEQRKQIEELARSRGVVLASAAGPTAAVEPVRSKGWLSRAMPQGAQLMAELKAQLDPEIYQGILERLKRGGGYVVDLSTMIAVGSPPVDEYERGTMTTRDGLTVMRVRRKVRP